MSSKLLDQLYETRLSPLKEIEHPPTLLNIVEQKATSTAYIPIFSLGDISLIQGRQKSKKTFFTSILSAQCISNEASGKLYANLEEGQTVAIFDTEQSEYYAQKTNKRVYNLCNGREFYYFALRDKTPIERKDIIEYFLDLHTGKINFILIDGIVDLLFDFNDLKECTSLVQWLMNVTKKHNVHCCTVLHENQSDGKARGHIGTLLAQKAESVLKIEKNHKIPNRSTISSKDTRGRQFIDFEIEIDSNGNAHLVELEQTADIF